MDFVHEWQQKLVDKLSIVEELREDRNLVHKGGLMAQTLNTIKKRSTFLNVKKKGQFLRSFSFNIQILKDMSLDNNINVGYTATKRLGNAIKRNKAKRMIYGLILFLLRFFLLGFGNLAHAGHVLIVDLSAFPRIVVQSRL